MTEQINKEEKENTAEAGNEINQAGKIVAGILLIIFTLIPLILIVAYWPDRLPPTNSKALYQHKWFQIQLIDSFYKEIQKEYADTSRKPNTVTTIDSLFNRDTIEKK